MSGFIQKVFIGLLRVCTGETFGGLLASTTKGPIKHVSLNNRLWQTRPTLVNINFHQLLYYPLQSMLINAMKVIILMTIHMLEYAF